MRPARFFHRCSPPPPLLSPPPPSLLLLLFSSLRRDSSTSAAMSLAAATRSTLSIPPSPESSCVGRCGCSSLRWRGVKGERGERGEREVEEGRAAVVFASCSPSARRCLLVPSCSRPALPTTERSRKRQQPDAREASSSEAPRRRLWKREGRGGRGERKTKKMPLALSCSLWL